MIYRTLQQEPREISRVQQSHQCVSLLRAQLLCACLQMNMLFVSGSGAVLVVFLLIV